MYDQINPDSLQARTLPAVECQDSLRSRKPRVKGQTTVEFALICLPFFAILFAIVDYAQIYFYENSLQNALRESCRFATAGRIIQTTATPNYATNSLGVVVPVAINDASGREASRNECIRYWFLSNSVIPLPLASIGISNAPTLPGVPPNVVTDGFHATLLQTNGAAAIKGPGDANDYIQISAQYTINTITPLFGYMGGYSRNANGMNSYTVTVSAIVKNEPALLNFQHTNMYSDEP
jgi:hypothetical protein